MTETFSLTREELRRIEVLSRVESGHLTAGEAGKLLDLSIRQVRRILAAYRKEGPAALAHGNRGRKPKHAISEETKARVVELARAKYSDYNHQHLSEELGGEGIAISRPSVRRILGAVGLKSPKTRRAPKHRNRRERFAQEGMLLQADGSPHDWLEGRGPRLTLHAAIDDATSKLVGGVFRLEEDAAGYLELFRQVVLREGVPLAVYHDRHDIFVQKPRSAQAAESRETIEEQLKGYSEPTQVGRALIELGIRSIEAHSPQAKGRVERLFQTLQDRLVKWLREKGVTSLDGANAEFEPFREAFNARFAVPAAEPGRAYRPLPEGFCPEQVFCLKYLRSVAPDNTLQFFGETIQILADDRRTSYAKARVEVHERLDQSLAVYHEGRLLATRVAPSEPKQLRARRGERPSPRPLVSGAQSASGLSASGLSAKGTRETNRSCIASGAVGSARADAESQAKPTESQERTPRTIEKSSGDATTRSDAQTLERDGGPEPEDSKRRAPGVGYVDKWTGERVVPPTPSSAHPWRRPLKARPNQPPANQARVTQSLNA
jgi:transposase